MNRDALHAFRTYLGEPGWDDVIAGHDFGFLERSQVQAWCRTHGHLQALASLAEPGCGDFEARLWAACREATGQTPRPGNARWAHAQDRWRLALLREALASESTWPHLARRVEQLYEQVGCPEDMLGMLHPSQSWSGRPATLDVTALQRCLETFRMQPIEQMEGFA